MTERKMYYKRPAAKFKGARLAWDYFGNEYPHNKRMQLQSKNRMWFMVFEYSTGYDTKTATLEQIADWQQKQLMRGWRNW